MHKASVALSAIPILVAVYLGAVLRRSTLARIGLGLSFAIVLGGGVIGAGRPAIAVANPPSAIVPLTQAAFRTVVATDRDLHDPVSIEFSTTMAPASVAAAIAVDPATAIDLTWDVTGRIVTISPRTMWAAGTFHTITVQAGALATTGQPLARPARAVFLTRAATTGAVIATDAVGTRVSIATQFRITFVRPVDPGSVRDGIHMDPPTPGSVQSVSSAEGLTRYAFVPEAPLKADVEYRLVVDGVRDVDGLALDPFSLVVRTVKAPEVVRFRPAAATRDVVRGATISVRFSDSMDRRATARAFTVSAVGQTVTGTINWAESDAVLIFTPDTDLPYGARVVVEVGPVAQNVAGVPLGGPGKSAFQTVAKPTPVVAKPTPVVAKPTPVVAKPTPVAPKPAPTAPTAPKPPSTGGGGDTVGSGSWIAVERYYLGLMNCTRTGGWVTSSGSCSAPGGRAVAALELDSSISSQVSRPYARQLAIGNDCSHFLDGKPGDRLRRAGFTSYRWAENIGCQSGSPMSVVLSTHLFFQREKSDLGGHYVNLMNAQYDRVGIGVWVSSGRVRLVVDFYHP